MAHRFVFFDWNGTLLDDLPVTYEAVQKIFWMHHLPAPSREEYRENIDSNFMAFYRARGIPDHVTPEELNSIWREHAIANWNRPTLNPFATKAVAGCRKRGIGTGIMSGEVPDILERRLAQFDIAALFDHVRGGAWPKETAFRETLEALGIDPYEAAYVDDTNEGLQTAKRLGLTTIGFTRGYASPRQIMAADPDFIVDSLSHVPLFLQSA